MSADRLDGFFRQGKERKKGEVPAFRFHEWPAGFVAELPPDVFKLPGGVVAWLPQPLTPFGLCLAETQLTDAGLKELAGLKSLQSHELVLDEGNGRGPEGIGRTEEPANR